MSSPSSVKVQVMDPSKVPESSWPSILPIDGKRSSASRLWRTTSAFLVPSVAVLSKLWLTWFNRVHLQHHDVFLKTLNDHFNNRTYPLVTLSNHHSCLDDPGLWGGLFPWKWNFNSDRHRWSAAAHDICFTKMRHAIFFSVGKTYPIIRGGGIDQKGIDYTIDLMRDNAFIHFFPQGRVVDDHEDAKTVKVPPGSDLTKKLNEVSLRDGDFDKNYELKWGLAKALLEFLGPDSSTGKRVAIFPFYHLGMNEALPNPEPGEYYIPRVFKDVYVSFRDSGPVYFDHRFLKDVCFNGDDVISLPEKRRLIMKKLEEELKLLKLKAIQFKSTLSDGKHRNN